MESEVKKWGNSFAIRLPKSEAERLGLVEGDHVSVEVRKTRRRAKRRISLDHLPVFHDTATDVSELHDEYLYGGRK